MSLGALELTKLDIETRERRFNPGSTEAERLSFRRRMKSHGMAIGTIRMTTTLRARNARGNARDSTMAPVAGKRIIIATVPRARARVMHGLPLEQRPHPGHGVLKRMHHGLTVPWMKLDGIHWPW